MSEIITRLQTILNGAEERELDGTEKRVLKDAIYEIKELRKKCSNLEEAIDYLAEFLE